jgi:hypothetical protein
MAGLIDLLRQQTPSALTANPSMLAQAAKVRESQFQSGIRSTPWFREFVREHGEQPDLSRNADYDYRGAWQAGLRPSPDPYDNNRHHWPSSLPNGEMLKAPDHPTMWKELFMRATGQNPDALGITQEQAMRVLGK